MPQTVIVDVAKHWIDICALPEGTARRIDTTSSALARFARTAGDAFVVFEASGGYERPLMDALGEASVAYARVNPAKPVTLPGQPDGSPSLS